MQLKSILLAVLLSSSIAALAQESTTEETTPGISKNFIKVNLTSLPLKNFHLQYERVLSKRVSIAIGGRYMPTSTIPFKSLVIKAIGDDDQDTKDLIEKSQIGNFAITPEVRFYLGKGYGKGFYIAPYYRYANFSTNTITLNFSETNGPSRSLNLNGEMSGHTGGIMFGAQWFLGKTITLDWWIIGAHYGTGKGIFTGTPSTPFTPGEQADIRQTLEDIDVPLIDKTVSVSPNNVTVKTDGAFGGLRGGILLGVRF
ncbi:MAG TPA: DUF3575 domain-containing protein [Flavisolibacter sp.]|jgi:hypothetical protein